MRERDNGKRPRWFGWWFVCIGVAFALLGASRLIRGEGAGPAVLRFAAAAAFLLLGYLELRLGRWGGKK